MTAPAPAEMPLRPALANYLLDHADRRGWIGHEPPAIAASLKASLSEVVVVLWDFQRQGHLKLRQTQAHGKGQSNLTGLRLTATGRQAFRVQAATEAGVSVPENPTRLDALGADRARKANDELQNPLPRRKTDRTDFRTHSTIAVGGPVEHIRPVGPTPPLDELPDATPVGPATSGTLAPVERPWVPEPADYPVIAGLLGRQDALVEAAALLERAGQKEMAEMALERAAMTDESLTPIEAEAVRLWRAVTAK